MAMSFQENALENVVCEMADILWSFSCLERYHFWGPSQYKDAVYYHDVTMSATASQITSLTIVYSTVYSGAEQRKKLKLRVTGREIHRSPCYQYMDPHVKDKTVSRPSYL